MNRLEELSQQLKKLADTDHAAQTYLFLSGDPKERLTLAVDFAKSLVSSPADILYTEHEKENVISVSDVRTQIGDTLHIKPYGDKKKVYIIRDADLLNQAAQNALLKTLEEPPIYACIFLLSEAEDAFLPTVLSRAVKIVLPKGTETLAVTDREDLTEEKALLLKGSRITPTDIASYGAYIKESKPDEKRILSYLREWFCDVLVTKTTGSPMGYDELIKKEQAQAPYENLNRIIEYIDQVGRHLSANVTKDISFMMLWETIKKELLC